MKNNTLLKVGDKFVSKDTHRLYEIVERVSTASKDGETVRYLFTPNTRGYITKEQIESEFEYFLGNV